MVKATTLLSAALPCTAGMHKWAAVAPLAMASCEEAADLLCEPGERAGWRRHEVAIRLKKTYAYPLVN